MTPAEISILGQFDAVLGAVLDEAYERADQKYRNAAKLLGGRGGDSASARGRLDTREHSLLQPISVLNNSSLRWWLVSARRQ